MCKGINGTPLFITGDVMRIIHSATECLNVFTERCEKKIKKFLNMKAAIVFYHSIVCVVINF